MNAVRREFLKLAGFGLATCMAPSLLARGARAQAAPMPNAGPGTVFNIRSYGAIGDGKADDTSALNRAIEAASVQGGTVFIPSGSYACYSIHLKSSVALYLDQGATILAAQT